MHELSIATRLIEIASERAAEAGGRVTTVTVRVGRLTCVHEDALRFGFDIAREGTPLDQAELRIVSVPVSVWCPPCGREFELAGIQRLACPHCGRPTADIRSGRELDLESIELSEPLPA
jgi:hydrogenase nickel incorporation protein HypA/HybF